MSLTERTEHGLIELVLTTALHEGWNRVPGVRVDGARLLVDPNEYFFRYEQPLWRLCDWELVRSQLLPVSETAERTVDQLTLEFIREHSFATTDPAEVLATAEKVYGFIFRPERLADPDLVTAGVTEAHLRILREMGTFMALNRVELDGGLANVGPAWFFCQLAESVYDLTEAETVVIDDLYHGAFFNEERRVESVKAHGALGGRLVHGCSATANMAGGCVVEYGTDVEAFQAGLRELKPAWLAEIARYPRAGR